jgi:hypothetical protein
MNDETIRLIIDLANSSKDTAELSTRLRELKTTTETAGDSVDKLEKKTEQLGKTGVKTGQSLLQGGRVVQDFAQGGLGGILNNIEGLTVALGMGPGMAGVLTVLGVVALTAGPAIKSFFQGWADGSNEVPKSADAIERLTDRIKDNAEALDGLKKKQALTNTELATFNRLTGEQIGNQKALDAAKKEQAAEKKLDEVRPQGAAEAERGRAEELQAQFGGRQDEIAGIMDKNIQADIDRITKQIRMYQLNIKGEPTDQDKSRVRGWQKQLVALSQQQQRGSKSILAGAMVGGKEEDIRAAMERLPMLEGLPGADVRRGMAGVLPENIAAADKADEKFQAGLDERSEAVKRRNERARATEEGRKRALAAEKQQTEEENNRQQARDKAHDETRRMSNQAAAAGQAQSAAGSSHVMQRLQQVPNNATEIQAALIMAQNQIALDAQIRADQQYLLALARRAQGNIAATNRSNQTIGPP